MVNKKVPFGLRIPEKLLDELKEISKKSNQSPNQIAIKAIEEWIDINKFLQNWRSMILTKELFSHMISFLNNEEILKLAEIAAKLVAEISRDYIETSFSKENAMLFIFLIPELFGEDGLLWFDSISIEQKKNIQIIKGFHYLNKKFSLFFTKMIENLMWTYFEHNIKPIERYEQNSIFIEIELAEIRKL